MATAAGNTLRDLFGVDPAVAASLPDEVSGEGCLNSVSPLLSEQYLAIANEVVNRVLAPACAAPTEVQERLFGALTAPGANLRAAAKTVARRLAREACRRAPGNGLRISTLIRLLRRRFFTMTGR